MPIHQESPFIRNHLASGIKEIIYTVRRYKFGISREHGRHACRQAGLVRILQNRRLACFEKQTFITTLNIISSRDTLFGHTTKGNCETVLVKEKPAPRKEKHTVNVKKRKKQNNTNGYYFCSNKERSSGNANSNFTPYQWEISSAVFSIQETVKFAAILAAS